MKHQPETPSRRVGGELDGRTDGADAWHPAGSPTALLGAAAGLLPAAERRVAEYIQRQPTTVSRSTISDIALATGSSTATVIRLARRLGFPGYRDLRIALAWEVGRAEGRSAPLTGVDVSPTDDLRAVVDKVAAADITAIRNSIDGLELRAFAEAVRALSGARRTLLIGVGAAGLVATDLRDKLYRVRKDVVAATERHAALTGAAMLTPQDVALGISHSGETEDVIAPMALAQEAGATTIALTNYRDSQLGRLCSIVISTAVSDQSFRSRGMASRAAMMTLIDCIFIAVVQTNYDGAMQALELTSRAIEQSGSSGRRRRR